MYHLSFMQFLQIQISKDFFLIKKMIFELFLML